MNIIRVGYLSGGNTLMVNVESGAVVSATNGTKTVTGVSVDGLCKLRVQAGTWTVIATKGSDVSQPVDVVVTDSYSREMSFYLPLSSLAEGALVKLNENGSGVNFFIGGHNYESGLNGAGRTILVRNTTHSSQVWNSSNNNAYSGGTLDNWFNSTYKSMLDASVQELISTTKFYYTPSGTNTSITTLSRSVFALSYKEFGRPGTVNSTKYCNDEGSALTAASTIFETKVFQECTRTPTTYTGDSYYKQYVMLIQGISTARGIAKNSYPARPCFTLPETALVNPTPNADGSYTLIS